MADDNKVVLNADSIALFRHMLQQNAGGLHGYIDHAVTDAHALREIEDSIEIPLGRMARSLDDHTIRIVYSVLPEALDNLDHYLAELNPKVLTEQKLHELTEVSWRDAVSTLLNRNSPQFSGASLFSAEFHTPYRKLVGQIWGQCVESQQKRGPSSGRA